MANTHLARILPFARPARSASATPWLSGGGSEPRRTTRRTPTGRVAIAVTFDLKRLQYTRRARAGPATHAPSLDARDGEAAFQEADPTALEVLPHLYGDDPHRWARFPRDVQAHAYFLVRGRTGAIVPTVVGRPARDTRALKSLGDLPTYRTLMGAWTWMGLVRAVCDTRSYEAGLDAGLLLLRVADQHRAHLSRREWAAHRKQLYRFILEMLDRLDQWEAYLETWARVRAHTAYAFTEPPDVRQQYGAQLTPYILREDADGVRVHFLWLTRYRKAVIERKVARQRRGQSLGHVWHATQDELSAAELRERLAWVARQAQEAAWRG